MQKAHGGHVEFLHPMTPKCDLITRVLLMFNLTRKHPDFIREQDGKASLQVDGFRRQIILRTCQICGYEDMMQHVEKMREIPAALSEPYRRGLPRTCSRPSSLASNTTHQRSTRSATGSTRPTHLQRNTHVEALLCVLVFPIVALTLGETQRRPCRAYDGVNRPSIHQRLVGLATQPKSFPKTPPTPRAQLIAAIARRSTLSAERTCDARCAGRWFLRVIKKRYDASCCQPLARLF